MTDFQHGTKASLVLNPGGTLTGYVESGALDATRETGEIRVWGGTSVERVIGLRDTGFTANGAWAKTLDGYIWAAYIAASPVSLVFKPNSTGTTTYTIDVIITSYSQTHGSGGASTWNLTIAGADTPVRVA